MIFTIKCSLIWKTMHLITFNETENHKLVFYLKICDSFTYVLNMWHLKKDEILDQITNLLSLQAMLRKIVQCIMKKYLFRRVFRFSAVFVQLSVLGENKATWCHCTLSSVWTGFIHVKKYYWLKPSLNILRDQVRLK